MARPGRKKKEWKKIYHTNINHKKADVTLLITDKVDLKIKMTTREKVLTIHQEDIIILNIYAPNSIALKYMKHKLTEQKLIA